MMAVSDSGDLKLTLAIDFNHCYFMIGPNPWDGICCTYTNNKHT